MSRTLTAALSTHLEGEAHTRCRMLRLDLQDGSALAVTDHDLDLAFDLGDGAETYSASTGMSISDVALSTGFDPDDVEVIGPVTDSGLTTRAALVGGRFDDAVARLFEIDWSNPDGALKLLKGRVVRADVEGDTFRLTIHSEISRFAQEFGRVITGYCDADFGDSRCGLSPESIVGTVTAVTDERTFAVSFSGSYADDFFNRGTVQFLTGGLAGTRRVEIFDWAADGSIALWAPLAAEPEVGDTLTIRQGCYDLASDTSKTREACMAFGNIANFRGFPDVPGTDQVLRYPNPGGG